MASQEPIDKVIEESAPEGVECILEDSYEHLELPTATFPHPLSDILVSQMVTHLVCDGLEYRFKVLIGRVR